MKSKIIILSIAIIVIFAIIVGLNIFNSNKTNEANKIKVNNEENIYESKNINNNTNEIQNNDGKSSQKKILIAVFSKTGENYQVGNVNVGNTMIMAQNIKSIVGGDIFEIVPVNSYPNDYIEATQVAQKEQNENARPEIKNKVENFNNYDIIFIGYPIWWGDMPQILYTFLESYDFSGKTIIPFNTHAGSGNSGTYNTIKSKLPNSNVLDGLAITGVDARKDESKTTIQNWINKLDIF